MAELKIDEVGILPDGSGFMTGTLPLPEDHWLYEKQLAPPMPLRMGTDDPRRAEYNKLVSEAARYAVRAATTSGKHEDFDPDAMVQNFIVGLLGYHTPDGLSRDRDMPEFNPDPVPPAFNP